jgi:penicillin amidase
MRAGVTIWRDGNGVPHVEAGTLADVFWGQGVAHATDRALQMLLARIVGQGRISELLDSSPRGLRLDTFFRRLDWAGHTESQWEKLGELARSCLAAYCDGINSVLLRRRPWEVKVLGYRPEPWRFADVVTLSRLMAYLGMQQTQAEIERLLVEMVQGGVEREKLDELFPDLLGELDVALVRKVELDQRLVPEDLCWGGGLPAMIASNNWVLSGAKTASGKPFLCNDPHLEGNHLPNVWAEIVLRVGERYAMGASLPGAPGVIIGRTNDVAWGVTYSFMDAVDSWIERCRDGKYFREPDQWIPFQRRTTVIRRRRKPPVELTIYENEHGLLHGDPYREGHYLATGWTAARSGAATMEQFLRMWQVRSAAEAMDVLGQVESAWNFVIADRQGNIGYQMSGLLPRRRPGASGFVPLPGWKRENDWLGMVSHQELPRVLNPPQGYFATANNDLNAHGQVRAIGVSMGPYRAERIERLLAEKERFALSDMFRMQYDLCSAQAERFLEILRPLLPDTPQADVLRRWDGRYGADSEGASLFERFYGRLVRNVFGQGGLGPAVIDHLVRQTPIFIVFFAAFDRVLLSERSAWFAGRSREQWYRQAAAEALDGRPQPWGRGRSYRLRHPLLGGRLPVWLGFDRGPVVAEGGRGTIRQAQIYRRPERESVFVPSYRLVVDMAGDECHTNLEGGPSDRRFSRWYCSDLENWLHGTYKRLTADRDQQRLPFA